MRTRVGGATVGRLAALFRVARRCGEAERDAPRREAFEGAERDAREGEALLRRVCPELRCVERAGELLRGELWRDFPAELLCRDDERCFCAAKAFGVEATAANNTASPISPIALLRPVRAFIGHTPSVRAPPRSGP